jgi:hypothetical protein
MDVMQITAEQALQSAMLTPVNTPTHHLAVQFCLLCGVDPNGYAASLNKLAQGPTLPNWQHVIAEQLIGSALRISLRNGPGGGGGLSIG